MQRISKTRNFSNAALLRSLCLYLHGMYDVSHAQKQGKEKAAGQPNPKTIFQL
jgi:hypothetical protein